MTHHNPPTLSATQRIGALPPKTAVPFRQLLAAGHISEEILHTILDAGDLARDKTRLLAFAASYLGLRIQNVPVHDVIAMAKSQNRRINLAWSPARWKDEHDKLSRAEALKRLSEENVRYDLSAYETHLPGSFPGYLIKSSRRLGMEGLRQRHCVASYDSNIRAGTSAIAAVFVDKQRWTVELKLTGDPDAPLRINQIKTRRNALPPATVRLAIHTLLGIELPRQKDDRGAPQPMIQDSIYMENLRLILPLLQGRGIGYVTVTFDGSGDSGMIEDIDYGTAENTEALKALPLRHYATQGYFEEGQWRKCCELQPTTLGAAIEALTYDYLEETGADWCNNDGGFGELVIDVAQATVSLEVNVRYTESTTEFSAERDIMTGEDI